MKHQTVVLGPYITRHSDWKQNNEDVADTGCVVEYSTATQADTLNIFHCRGYSRGTIPFNTYFVQQAMLPFEVMCFDRQVKDYHAGPYISLSALLAEMYDRYTGLRSIQKVLTDFDEVLPILNDDVDAPPATPEYPLRSDIAAAGYGILDVLHWGRRIDVEVGWRVPSSVPKRRNGRWFCVTTAQFRPLPNRTLNIGSWLEHLTHYCENLLVTPLIEMTHAQPISMLAEDTISRLLYEFPWTPLAQMTNKQAREARINFIRSHPDTATDIAAMAAALRQAGLYSPETSLSQIRRFLPSLINAAKLAAIVPR